MYFNTSDNRIPLQTNDIVEITSGERFVIDKFLASGGFCLMYLAHQEGTNRYVALKEAYPQRVENAYIQRHKDGHIWVRNPFVGMSGQEDAELRQQFEQYFQREVVLTQKAGAVYTQIGQQDQQNSLDVLQIEGPMTDTHGNLYLAVDTYQGEAFRDYIERGFTKDLQEKILSNQFLEDIIDIIKETTLRLSSLHNNQQLYHLDLSPDNIYLAFSAGVTQRQPFIIDYGSAYDKTNPREAVEHRYTYNPHSAPEILALSESPDPMGFYYADESSDTYSLVSILFYAATGLVFTPEMRMFSRGWKEQINKQYSSGLATDTASDSFSECLIHFFERGLSANQQNRFRSCKELLGELTRLEEGYRQYGNLLPLVPKDELMSYMLMEKHPLYNFKGEDGNIHVLCLGSGTFVKRMILSMISCGQIIDSALYIHIVSNEDEEVLRQSLLQAAPMLRDYSNLCSETTSNYVTFEYSYVEDVLDEDTCCSVLNSCNFAQYILISLGRNSRNVAAANLYARHLTAARRSANRKTIINYYCSEDAAKYTRSGIEMHTLPDWLEIDAFANDISSYTQAQRTLGLQTIRLAHLYDRIHEPEISLAESASRISCDAYAQRSSCAAALHLKYKLAGLGICPESSLQDIVGQYSAALADERYNRLLANEHNRWMMFMTADGYTNPTLSQLRQYGFEMVDGRFNSAWKCSFHRLHPCLVPCSDSGPMLNSDFWEMYDTVPKIMEAPLDALDKASLQLHVLSKQKCDFILSEKILEQQFGRMSKKLHCRIQETVAEPDLENGKLPKSHPIAICQKQLAKLRRLICKDAKNRQHIQDHGRLAELETDFAALGVNISEEIAILQQKLSVFQEYAAFRDYKTADEAIIRNLLWLIYADHGISMI